jgi:CheY-like chemotaxis protein
MTRKLTAHLLASMGCRCTPLQDGEDVLSLFHCDDVTNRSSSGAVVGGYEGPKIDVVFMDIVMRRVGGIEATAALLAGGITIPIVAVTAQASPQDLAAFARLGFAGCIPKPFTKSDLVRELPKYIPDFFSRTVSLLKSNSLVDEPGTSVQVARE